MTDIDSDSGTISACNPGGLEEVNKGQGQGASEYYDKSADAHHRHASGQQQWCHIYTNELAIAKKTMIKDTGKICFVR